MHKIEWCFGESKEASVVITKVDIVAVVSCHDAVAGVIIAWVVVAIVVVMLL